MCLKLEKNNTINILACRNYGLLIVCSIEINREYMTLFAQLLSDSCMRVSNSDNFSYYVVEKWPKFVHKYAIQTEYTIEHLWLWPRCIFSQVPLFLLKTSHFTIRRYFCHKMVTMYIFFNIPTGSLLNIFIVYCTYSYSAYNY